MPVGSAAVEALLAYLGKRLTLTAADAALVRSLLRPRNLRRGECIQRAGEVPSHAVFVARGCLRGYVVEADGREHTLHLAVEDWWLGDYESAQAGTPSPLVIEAIEPSEVCTMSNRDHDLLIERLPGYAAAFAQGLRRRLAARDRWVLGAMNASAEERYRDFRETYPAFAARVPQHMIASYLGLTPETLSRVRRKIADRGERGQPAGGKT